MSVFYTTVARFYDAETGDKTDDLAMYSRLAEQYEGGILDIGCGTGRVLIHLAQEGYTVHGIDNDRAMLDRLDRKLEMMPHLKNIDGAITKNLFLKDKAKKLYLLSTLHDRKIDLKDIAKKAGTKDMRFGDEKVLLKSYT